MNCKFLLSYFLHYHGVLVVKIRNNYYKYVHYKYAECPLSHHINMCGLLSE